MHLAILKMLNIGGTGNFKMGLTQHVKIVIKSKYKKMCLNHYVNIRLNQSVNKWTYFRYEYVLNISNISDL